MTLTMIPSSDTGFLKDLNSCPLLPSCKMRTNILISSAEHFRFTQEKLPFRRYLMMLMLNSIWRAPAFWGSCIWQISSIFLLLLFCNTHFTVTKKWEIITSKSMKNSTKKQIFQCFITILEMLCSLFHREANKKYIGGGN